MKIAIILIVPFWIGDKISWYLSNSGMTEINIMAIFIVFLIAKNMARQHHEDETKTGLIALAVFFLYILLKQTIC